MQFLFGNGHVGGPLEDVLQLRDGGGERHAEREASPVQPPLRTLRDRR